MIGLVAARRVLVVSACVALTVTGCGFDGVNSLRLPGAVGRGSGAQIYHVEIANVGTLESNSPVMIDDVVVGSVGKMTVNGWHADVEVSVQPGTVVPANAVASVGQTSLLGSMHLALNPPLGQPPQGKLEPGATIPLNKSSTYPSTEQTLSSLSVIVNGGGLGQIGDIIHSFNAALSGREGPIRDLLTRLEQFVGTLDGQRDNIIASIHALSRVSGALAGQRDVITRALDKVPPALDVLIKERPRITTALENLGSFSDTATRVVNDTQADLVKNLQNLQPTLQALADVGPDLDRVLALAPTFPVSQDFVDRAVRGDYLNLFVQFDLTVPRLKRTLFLGTRWGQEGAPLVPAPGEPWYLNYTYDPLSVGIAPSPPDAPPPPPPGAVLGPAQSAPPSPRSIFAGPYGAETSSPPSDRVTPPAQVPPTPGDR